jgi:hypothetical protein
MTSDTKRPQQTLFMSQEDMRKALLTVIDLLSNNALPQNEAGMCSINELCVRVKEIDPHLHYINRNHIVELYFKDRDRKIFICGLDEIKYKEVRYVAPPDILYFGTLSKLVGKMKLHGLRSSTKGYLKLYDTPEHAADFARKFINSPDDKVVTLTINAKAAFTEGMRFTTYKPHEYVVVRIDRKFITGDQA